MIPIGYFRDRTHGRRIPTGRPLAHLTQAVLGMAAGDAIRQLRAYGQCDLSRWIPSFVEAAKPMIQTFVREGQRTRAKELLAAIEKRKRRKSLWPQLTYGFDVYNHRIDEYIRTSTYNFVESTLRTASEDAAKAYERFRKELGASLRSGEGIAELNARIYGIFTDTYRAARAGQTEAARSVAGGGYMLAQESGATIVRWLASSDACEICLRLNGQERELGKPFMIFPKARPGYQIILHSPAHCHCFCTEEYVIADAVSVNENVVGKLKIAAYDPSAVPNRFQRGERLAASLWGRR